MKCPNSALKLKFSLSSFFDKLIAGRLISPCSFGVLPGDCSVDGFFARRCPCLTLSECTALIRHKPSVCTHRAPLVLLLSINLFFCLFIAHSVERNCRRLDRNASTPHSCESTITHVQRHQSSQILFCCGGGGGWS